MNRWGTSAPEAFDTQFAQTPTGKGVPFCLSRRMEKNLEK